MSIKSTLKAVAPMRDWLFRRQTGEIDPGEENCALGPA